MLNIELLNKMIEEGYVNEQSHPIHDLFIYNYAPKTQYERVWNEVTLACRGLILDGKGNIVARPFTKFFNLGEMENQVIPNEPFEVYEKMDGSLGILYWADNQAFIATRGSFMGEQAVKGSAILIEKYATILRGVDKTKTYLFEIIYPENRIVVNYGDIEDLILLAIIDNATGADEPLHDIGFPMVKQYHGIKDIHTLKNLADDNREGFVIKYKNGLRVKVKFEEYMRIHRIVTQVSNVNIWEYLSTNMPFDEILDRVPDEFYDWVKKVSTDLQNKYQSIESQCQIDFKTFDTRKEAALYFQTCAYPSVLFKLLDGKPYSDVIWKMLKPKFQKPFKNEI
jgi:hypothetical protein